MNAKLKGQIVTQYGSQVVFAGVSGIPENKLSYIIREHRKPTEWELLIFEKFLGISREEFFGEEVLYGKRESTISKD